MILGGIGFGMLSMLMVHSPKRISISDAFPLWCIWILIAVILSGIAYLRVDTVTEQFFEDDILDDNLMK